jgi:hypothetical protein
VEIELADAVAAMRDELLTAAARSAGQEIAFVVGPIEMEFAVELRADATARVGFTAWVVSADVEAGADVKADVEAEAGVGRSRTHRVKVALTPQRPGGGDLLISAAPAAASGEAFDPGDASGWVGR